MKKIEISCPCCGGTKYVTTDDGMGEVSCLYCRHTWFVPELAMAEWRAEEYKQNARDQLVIAACIALTLSAAVAVIIFVYCSGFG